MVGFLLDPVCALLGLLRSFVYSSLGRTFGFAGGTLGRAFHRVARIFSRVTGVATCILHILAGGLGDEAPGEQEGHAALGK